MQNELYAEFSREFIQKAVPFSATPVGYEKNVAGLGQKSPSATSGATSGATDSEKNESENQRVKCQVRQVSPVVWIPNQARRRGSVYFLYERSGLRIYSPYRHCAPPSSKSFESLDLVFHCVSGSCDFRIPLAFVTSLHSPQECRTFAATMPGQSEPSPNREINVVRRLPQTTSLTAVRMAVSSVSRQLPTCLPRTLDLGAATDGDANEQVPTELSGQAIFDIMERYYGKNRVRLYISQTIQRLQTQRLKPPFAPFEASIRIVWSLQTSQDYWTEGRFAIYCTGGLSLAIISILETGQRNDFHSVRTSIGHLAACDHNHQIGFAQWHLFLILIVFMNKSLQFNKV